MKKFQFAWMDVAIGAVVSVLMLALFWSGKADGLENKFYDMRAKMRASKNISDKVIYIGISDLDVDKLGRFPWPRNYYADMIDYLKSAGAKVIVLDIAFNQPENNAALDTIKTLAKTYDEKSNGKGPFKEVSDALNTEAAKLDNDEKLSASIAFSENTVLPMFFHHGPLSMGKTGKAIPESVEKNFAANIKGDPAFFSADDFTPPFEKFAKDAKTIGTINTMPDADGIDRAYPLVVNYEGRLFPSLALAALQANFALQANDYRLASGDLTLGSKHIPIDTNGTIFVDYIKQDNMQAFGFSEVREGKKSQNIFTDKIVVIGVALTGSTDQHTTPVGTNIPGMFIHGNILQGILNDSYIVRPTWAPKFELAVMLFLALFISLAIPHISAGRSAIIAAILLVVITGSGFYLFTSYGFFIKIVYPILMLAVGYTVVVSKRYLYQEQRTELLEGESAETNKMLGLSFQGQGMLDMAFEKFRKVPVDDSMKETLYNLALDFERKRQLNKAASVYEHIMSVDQNFKDIKVKAEKLKAASETMMFGGTLAAMKAGNKGGAEATMLSTPGVGDLAKQTLGRYEVTKVLGQGAMGQVFLGRDPKINRTVAIKTMLMKDEFDPADVAVMRERFFREAESAGRLIHPNIVTIYDAGEDGEISYIAMELLSGTDLKEFSTKDKLLPKEEVIEIIAKVADALDYAHSEGIVHRDIKPANIMRLSDGKIKVADFGIARITSQSKTATGTVMGTPSYMSPEQLAGQKVDGRADLFSLGVTLYELLTGEKPFTGESVATLMYSIANQPHPPIEAYRSDLPEGIRAIIDKALAKNPEQRYLRGNDMAKDLRKLLGTA
jgi:CHASE2 domain-containing sensor protein/tRNA A-37 threonylcarbamoyl transferase component Bud32